MENNKSRVVKYAQLRKEIAQMDDYTFTPAEKAEKATLTRKEETKDDDVVLTPGIKKNTLSMSLDEILDAQDKYDSKAQEREARKAYVEKRKEERSKRIRKILLWTGIGLLACLILVLALILIFK